MSKKETSTSGQVEGGGPTQETVKIFGQEIEAAQQSPYMILNPVFSEHQNPNQARRETLLQNATKFPVRPIARDKDDSMQRIKSDVSRSPTMTGAVNNFGLGAAAVPRPVPFTDDDISYYKRKRDAEEYAGFLTWGASRFNLNDPATRTWYMNVNPEWFRMQESLIDEQLDLIGRVAKTRLHGARTPEDMKIQYLIDTKRLTLPKGPVWEPFEWMLKEAGVAVPETATINQMELALTRYNSGAYRRGLFNPIVPVGTAEGGRGPNPYDLSDPMGNPGQTFAGAFGASIPITNNYAINYGGPGLIGNRYTLNNYQPYVLNNDLNILEANKASKGRR